MVKSLFVFFKSYPLNIIFWKLSCKLLGQKIPIIQQLITHLTNKDGIEIGGPSAIFKSTGFCPIYSSIRSLDGVNFSNNTLWESKLDAGATYKFEDKLGTQYIAEATDLPAEFNDKYHFVLSCNNLEHIANPIKALQEWKRIIKNNGLILLILPNKVSNFDHKRSCTTLQHLVDDYKNEMTENDLTHIDEILQLHDLTRDPMAGTFSEFKNRCLNNINIRGMHHHVYDLNVLTSVLDYCNLQILLKYSSKTDHFILAQKLIT